jgi:hypothetical protein
LIVSAKMIIGRIAQTLIRPACAGHLLPGGEGTFGAVAPLSLGEKLGKFVAPKYLMLSKTYLTVYNAIAFLGIR